MSKVNIDLNKQVVRKHSFKPVEAYNMLCLGKMVSATVELNDVPTTDKDGTPSTYEFAGKQLPNIVLVFNNITSPIDPAEREFSYRESVVGTIKKDNSAIDDKDLNSLYSAQWQRICHICETYVGDGKLRENKKVMAATTKWLAAAGTTSDAVVKATTEFFTEIANFLNTAKEGKPVYTEVQVWLKLLADYSSGKYFTFPNFVGDGFIERVKFDVNKSRLKAGIEVKANEMSRVTLTATKRPAGQHGGGDAEAPNDVADILKRLAEEQGR